MKMLPSSRYRRHSRASEQGSALIYILIAIALLALLTVSFMEPSSQQTNTQNSFKLVSELQSQADFIRSTAQECVLVYTAGDKGTLPPNPVVQYNQPFPLMPDEPYLNACVANPAKSDTLVSHIRCPGRPGDDPCHMDIFGGSTGKFMPQPPALFGQWQWYNGPDGVFIWTATEKTDAFIATALEKLDANYAACESDKIDASGGADVPLDNAGLVKCPDGSSCFRVWIVSDTNKNAPDDSETSLYPDETGCNTP